MPRAVDVLDDQHAPGLEPSDEASHRLGRIGQMGEQEPGVHEIEPLGPSRRLGDVLQPELDVLHPSRQRLGPGQLELGLVDIGTDDPPPVRETGQRDGDVPAAAPNIQTARILRHPDPLQQLPRGRPHDPPQHPQPLPPRDPPADEVVILIRGPLRQPCSHHDTVLPTRRSRRIPLFVPHDHLPSGRVHVFGGAQGNHDPGHVPCLLVTPADGS
jgi:hypothetical protein